MAELFIELLGEEIPARMQSEAEGRFSESLKEALKKHELLDDDFKMRSWSGPRRVAVSIDGVLPKQADIKEERRGPRADAPEQAVAGFLRGAGITLNEVEKRITPKGEFLFAIIEKQGQEAGAVIPLLLNECLQKFHWAKSMRWGNGSQTWIRPLHRISVLLNGEIVNGAFSLGGGEEIIFGGKTLGHRLHGDTEITLSSGSDYEMALKKYDVIASRTERKEIILKGIQEITTKSGYTIWEDNNLLEEVAGLVEYPHPIMGDIADEYMSLPREILITTMAKHQRYFAVAKDNKNLASHFITISNMPPDVTRDALIRKGNERVLNARFADAQFFWQQDIKKDLISLYGQLKGMSFFENLGTLGDKTDRLHPLAKAIAKHIGADGDLAQEAGGCAKVDLATQTVGELPELQGIIGGHLAPKRGLSAEAAKAVREHYRPIGANDQLPVSGIAQAVALADKIDTLVGFFSIGLKPTSSKDPYALRRAALGVIRIIVEKKIRIPLSQVFAATAKGYQAQKLPFDRNVPDLLLFFYERFRIWLREKGFRYDVIAAVIQPCYGDDFFNLYERIEKLDEFLSTTPGKNFTNNFKRLNNILTAEEKKDRKSYQGDFDIVRCSHESEKFLAEKILDISSETQLLNLSSLENMNKPIETFFENVIVNDKDSVIRRNRLELLAALRNYFCAYADFTALEG